MIRSKTCKCIKLVLKTLCICLVTRLSVPQMVWTAEGTPLPQCPFPGSCHQLGQFSRMSWIMGRVGAGGWVVSRRCSIQARLGTAAGESVGLETNGKAQPIQNLPLYKQKDTLMFSSGRGRGSFPIKLSLNLRLLGRMAPLQGPVHSYAIFKRVLDSLSDPQNLGLSLGRGYRVMYVLRSHMSTWLRNNGTGMTAYTRFQIYYL